jgi:hypothetical protein
MTHIVVLTPAVRTTRFDEIAVYNQALPASAFAGQMANQFITYLSDPQETAGWEEVYGPDYPLTAGQLPVMRNGLVQVRYLPAEGSYVVSVYIPGLGYVEQGRVTVWHQDAGGALNHVGTVDPQVISWTPERAVVRNTTRQLVAGAEPYRMDCYVTLQRGWLGPRFELYPNPRLGAKLGAEIRYTPQRSSAMVLARSINALSGGSPSWAVQNWLTYTGVHEPHVALLGGQVPVYASVVQAGTRIHTYRDTVAYGTARDAFAHGVVAGTAQAGYVSMHLGFPRITFGVGEAEAHRNPASGTATVQADAAASGGQAVQETVVAAPANHTLYVPNSRYAMPRGVYAVYGRARVIDAGATGNLLVGFWSVGAGTGATVAATFNSQAYTWVYLGELTNSWDDSYTYANMWRVAGTGNTRVDQVVLLPLEQRTGDVPGYDGARDFGASHLYDSRAVPELVSR